MPHFILDCSSSIVNQKSPEEIMSTVFETAYSTGLFDKGDIKVRLNPFTLFQLGEGKEEFIHVFANIMQGRTDEQKKDLSTKVVTVLKKMFPDVPIISMNVRDFEAASYCNRSMV